MLLFVAFSDVAVVIISIARLSMSLLVWCLCLRHACVCSILVWTVGPIQFADPAVHIKCVVFIVRLYLYAFDIFIGDVMCVRPFLEGRLVFR